MQSKARTVEEYLDELPADRRTAIEAMRRVILDNLDDGFEEGMQYGMIGYFVPHRIFPAGYHCNPEEPLPFASIASQKGHMALYLMCLYMDSEADRRFRDAWKAKGKKLDMGKSCLRFKKLEDLDLGVIGDVIRSVSAKAYVEHYQQLIATPRKKPDTAAAAKKKAPAKRK